MLFVLNFYNDVYQLFLKRTGKNKLRNPDSVM